MQDLLRLGFKPLETCVIDATAELRMRQTLGEQDMQEYIEGLAYMDLHCPDDDDDDAAAALESEVMTSTASESD